MVKLVAIALLLSHVAYADAIRIQTDATLQKRATARSRALLEVSAGEFADLLAEKNGWVKVRVRDVTGWIPQESILELDDGATDDAPPAEEPPPVEVAAVEPADDEAPVDEVEAEAPAPAPRERRVDIEVTAGLSVISQGFRTKGGTGVVPDNYNVGVTAATVALATGYRHRFGDIVVDTKLAYAYRRAVPGLRLADPLTGDVVTTGFAIHDVDFHIAGGYDFGGVIGTARAGVRYHLFVVEGVQDPAANPALVPSELRLSPTFGFGADIPHITDKLGLSFTLDLLVGSQTKQTAGLEDGVKADARGALASATLTYRWRPTLDVRAAYDLDVTNVDFGAPKEGSMREHVGTSSSRFDVTHVMTIGLAKGF